MIPEYTRFIVVKTKKNVVVLIRSMPTNESWIIHVYESDMSRSPLTMGSFLHSECEARIEKIQEEDGDVHFIPYT